MSYSEQQLGIRPLVPPGVCWRCKENNTRDGAVWCRICVTTVCCLPNLKRHREETAAAQQAMRMAGDEKAVAAARVALLRAQRWICVHLAQRDGWI
jgi:hypothetical protein